MGDKERVELLISYLQGLVKLTGFVVSDTIDKSIEVTTKEIERLLIK